MSLLVSAGNLVEEQEKPVAIATSYLRDMFQISNHELIDETLTNVTTTISDQLNADLTAPVSEWEVKLALFTMHPEKAPCPDGLTVLFYQK